MRLLLTCLLLLVAMPARAAWMEASSDHFLIYADAKPEWLRTYAEQLEKFDKGLRVQRNLGDDTGRRSNRLTIYVVANDAQVRAICSFGMKGSCGPAAGFYLARIGGSVAYTPESAGFGDQWSLNARTVLLHEYAHHFMYQNFPAAYPRWLSEGFAEFNSTAKFEKDGGVGYGLPAKHRAYGLFSENVVPIRLLLASEGKRLSNEQLDQLYGRGWLLTHYLTLGRDKRAGQLETYIGLINRGIAPLPAAEQAFGDLDLLRREMDNYLRRRTITYMAMPAETLPIGKIALRPLTPGEAAAMPVRMRSDRGVNDESAKVLVPQARKAAGPFPNDAGAQIMLAEAEFDAGNLDEAMAAAERAMAADPKRADGFLYKARVLMARADKSGVERDWKVARAAIARANRLDSDAAEPLMLYYLSFIAAKEKPSELAVKGLYRAFELSPEDSGLRWLTARQLIKDGELKRGRTTLNPLAYDPHATADNRATVIVSAIDAGKPTGDIEAMFEAGSPEEKGGQ